MAPFEALCGRRCCSPIRWFETSKAILYGSDLVKDALEKVKLIQQRLRTAQSRQRSYPDQKVRDLSFMVGEKVLLKVSLMKGIMRFGKKGKLSLSFIGPFEVLRRVREVAYELDLSPSLLRVHLVFYVSMLRKYHADRSHVLDYNTVQQDESLGYDEEPVAIVDRQVYGVVGMIGWGPCRHCQFCHDIAPGQQLNEEVMNALYPNETIFENDEENDNLDETQPDLDDTPTSPVNNPNDAPPDSPVVTPTFNRQPAKRPETSLVWHFLLN
ncbi:uncharacterized protein [Nicotiana sylvestris]|uniref:uncharacterized protein n=1 Tax=Nicotiana sylvestris TaxID=4096 RepID=UPI00388C97DB